MTKFIVFMAILSGALVSVLEYTRGESFNVQKKAINPLEVKTIDKAQREEVTKLLRAPQSIEEDSQTLTQTIKTSQKEKTETQEVIDSSVTSDAAVGRSNNTALGIVQTANDNSKFVTNIGVTYYTDMRKSSDYEKTSYSEGQVTLGYRMTPSESISLYIPFAKELSQEYNENLSDGKLSYTKLGLYKSELYHFYLRASYVYPLSKDSKVRDEMYFALELNPTSIWSLEGLTRGLSFTYLPRIKRSFHKYEYDRTGRSLTETSLIQYFLLDYAFVENWNYEIGMIYVNGQTYKGRSNDPSYLAVNEISYSQDNYTYTLGLQTGGALSKPEYGKSDSIQLYDSQTSEVYAGVSVNF